MTNIVVGLLLIVLVLGALYFFGPDSLKFWQDQTAAVGDSSTEENPSESQPETVTAKHQFAGGKHIIAGEANVPTPCHILNVTAQVAESFPEQVTLAFRTQTNAEVCAQVITPARFKVEFNASQNAQLRATWNGAPVQLNLVPAGTGENLEDFDVFFKG